VLLTGMSGTGKSTLIGRLAALGYRAIDADTEEWSEWVTVDGDADPGSIWSNRDWVWREDRMEALLAAEHAGDLFVSGTAANQGKFHPHFDHIVLLSAPTGVLVERLSTRTTNSYGKSPEELTRVLEHVQTIEPLLRRAATVEIDTSIPIDRVLEAVLDLVRPELIRPTLDAGREPATGAGRP
jgi:broad-specificity NMP kinase